MARMVNRPRNFAGTFRFPLLVAIALGLALVAVGCGGGGGGETPEPQKAAATEKTAPAFTLNDLDGNPVSLADSGGKVRIIDFWATWCPPCREEVPMYKELHAEYAGKGLQIIAVSMDDEDNRDLVRKFNQKNNIEYTSLMGTEDVSSAYEVMGLPATYVIDQEGNIVKSFVGPKPKKVLVGLIEGLLNGSEGES